MGMTIEECNVAILRYKNNNSMRCETEEGKHGRARCGIRILDDRYSL